MNTTTRFAAGLATLSLFALAHASPPTVNPEQMDLDMDMTAKIMKEKSKRNTEGGAAAGSPGGSSSKDCGTVNINSTDKKSGVGTGGIGAKPSTTIVLGPVINMANCK